MPVLTFWVYPLCSCVGTVVLICRSLAPRSRPAARISVLRCTLACGHCNRDLSRVQRIPVSLQPSRVSVGPPVTWEQLLGICRVSCGTCWAKAAGGVWRKVSCGFLMGASSICGVPLRMCVCCLPLVTLHGATSMCGVQDRGGVCCSLVAIFSVPFCVLCRLHAGDRKPMHEAGWSAQTPGWAAAVEASIGPAPVQLSAAQR